MMLMAQSKLVLKIDSEKLLVGYQISGIPLESNRCPSTIQDRKSATHNKYDMVFKVSKKMRSAINTAIGNKSAKSVLTSGNITLGLIDQSLTLVVNLYASVKKITKHGAKYSIIIQDSSMFDIQIEFDEVFYKTLADTRTPVANETNKQTQHVKPINPVKRPVERERLNQVNKQKKKQKQDRFKAARRRAPAGGSLIWAPDGSLIKKGESSVMTSSLPKIYHSNSSQRNCSICQNLNSGNKCAVHGVLVSDDNVCSRFYRFSIVLGGGVNPR